MTVTSYSFLVFLALVAFIYRLCPTRLRSVVPFAASYAFYLTVSPWLAVLLMAATIAAFMAARAMEAARNGAARRGAAFAFVAAAVATLALFKAGPLLPAGWRENLLMPLGLSFYTFKLIAYVIDVYWGKTTAEKHFFRFAAFVAFFPQILAGPIQRSESLLPQLAKARTPRLDDYLWGCQRLLLGYFKKLVVADNLALVVNFVYRHFDAAGTPVILGFYLYPLQMYADFSGLTDIAIGSAALLGITSPENFEAPFSAASPSEYWRRQHITLTTWLTDYVFTPLRTAVRDWGNAGLVFSLFVNMILIGLWHGLRAGFAVFGALHAVYLSVDALTSRWRKRYWKAHPVAGRFANWAGPVLTFHLVAFSLVFFRGESLRQAFFVLGHLAQGAGSLSPAFTGFLAVSGRAVLTGLGGYVLLEWGDYARRLSQREGLELRLPRWGRWSVYSCTVLSMVLLAFVLLATMAAPNPFLYAIF
jgi:alginate O-acetyltransferase complex protein AlgI